MIRVDAGERMGGAAADWSVLWHKAAMLAWSARQSLTGGLADSLRDQD